MRLTKHVHACVSIEEKGRTLLIDPGVFDPRTPELLEEADAVLISHSHVDHMNRPALEAELAKRPSLPVYGLEPVVGPLAEIGSHVSFVKPGETFTAAGFDITTFGGTHAEIYPHVPLDPSVGFLVDNRVYHPGDSYALPDLAITALLVPVSGPWTRFADAVAFVNAIAPRRAIVIHDAAFSEIGLGMVRAHLGEGGHTKVPVELLEVGETTDI
ncbi:MBL fold metallo-hydrolase [Demequina zhanjiangensis]|uniref:MBL fold metallo-hydrolase n=1 Tax=Demequina zhanjiangensis TaxID=3051659 RepID=A0ABT8FZW8_9MICO|nr:MBL fold metallo-hydrolase [Demequina sp. SYSU T00b26]MDN4472439.1 MBL fold metallo-hydrolase [Demequina sp. SYSU T00b26]